MNARLRPAIPVLNIYTRGSDDAVDLALYYLAKMQSSCKREHLERS